MSGISLERLDHLVLTVADIERTVAFYTEVLGMRAVTFGAGRRALDFGPHKINLHEAGNEFDPKAARPTPGSADLCLVSATPVDAIMEHLLACGVDVEEGPVGRTGAQGPITSVYFRDPDGNLIEVANY
jgi:catechol 2,3-dioxygenase-like lactoylglutathione lyase family enzyme